MLQTKNINKTFGNKVIWENVSLNFQPSKITAITGESGKGKTTLLNCLGLLESIDTGQIILDNQDVTNFSESKKRILYRDIYGFLFQNYGLIDNESIKVNLKVALHSSKLDKPKQENAMTQILEKVGLSYLSLGTKIYTLSGGEQQRVALARCLLKQPKIILSDEPSAALDEVNTLKDRKSVV
jgi:putative ABC transport system ATP-binding protein